MEFLFILEGGVCAVDGTSRMDHNFPDSHETPQSNA